MIKYNFFNYLWLVIIAPKPIQMAILIFFLGSLIYKYGVPKRIPKEIYFVFLFSIFQLFSVFINAFMGYGTDRIFAGLNTSMIWIIGILYYIIYSNIKLEKDILLKILIRNYIVLMIMAIGAYILGNANIPISILNRNLYNKDWFMNEENFRLVAFMEYPNLTMLFGILLFPWIIEYLKNRKINSIVFLITIVIAAFPIYLTKSRMGIALIGIGILYTTVFYLFKTKNKKITFIIILIISLIFSFQFLNIDLIYNKVFDLISGRAGSTSDREMLYSQSIKVVMQNRPLLGMGIKTINPTFNVPFGSHSTYIGTLYKAGLIGVILLFFGIIAIIYKMFKSSTLYNKMYFFVFYLLYFISLSVEDIDGNSWIFVLAFTLFACFNNLERRSQNYDEKNESYISKIMD